MLGKKRWVWGVLSVFLVADAALLLSVLFAPLIPISPNPALLPTAEYLLQHPASKPGFLFLTQQGSGCSGVGLSIDEKPFAEFGLPQNELSNHINKHFTFTIDGVQVQSSPYIFRSDMGTLDCDGGAPNLKCWSSTQLCYVNEGLRDGLHLAEFTLTDMSGKQYAYQWAFTSVSETPTPTP